MAVYSDLTRMGVCMSTVISLLKKLEPIRNGDDVYDKKDDFCIIAYACRAGILDRIEENNWSPMMILTVKTGGLFSVKKMALAMALSITIGQLKKMVEKDVVTAGYVEDILSRGHYFYTYERAIPDVQKQRLLF